MWDSGLKYGKIAELFSKLHCNTTRGGTARPYSDMTGKTLKHRKDFIKNVLDERNPPTPFPVAFDAPDAQLCASKFLEENFALFEGDSPRADGRFAYPADSGEIINLLAKIICTQEVMYHRNQLHAEQRKVNKDDTIAVETHLQEEGNTVSARSTPPPAKTKQTEAERILEFEQTHLPQNIQINLNAAYPLVPKPPFKETQWVFEAGSRWPEELESFTFRWLHEHQAYKITHANDHIRNFIVALKTEIELPALLTSDQKTKLYNKTHKFLSNWVRTWSACGLLVEKPDGVYRHRELEKALNIRRAEYIAIVLKGYPSGSGMLTPDEGRSVASLKRAGNYLDEFGSDDLVKKRLKAATEHHLEFQVSDDIVEPRPKTIIKRSFGPVPAHASRPASPDSFHHGRTPTEIIGQSATDPFDSLYPPRSTNSPFEPLRTTSRQNISSRNGSPVIPGTRSTPTPTSLESTNTTTDSNGQAIPFRYLPPLPPGNSAVRHMSENRSSSRHSLPLPRTTTTEPAQREKSADASRRSSASFVASAPAPAPIDRPALPTPSPQPQTPALDDGKPHQAAKPTVPTLFLIVEKAEGALDSENPLTEPELRNSTLSEFFDKVISRRQSPETPISRLRLVQRWGAKISIVVDRNTTDEQWKQVRGDIRRNFQWQSEKKPGKLRFEVYVICEIDGQSSGEEEEEY